jgi:hypothetical protein
MDVMDAQRVREICEAVWRDRVAIVTGRGILSGEDALVRAVYWRLCKAGDRPVEDSEDYTPFLQELVRQYRDEAA